MEINKVCKKCIVSKYSVAIKDSARTIEEIADIMNVSPVYVESEIDFLSIILL